MNDITRRETVQILGEKEIKRGKKNKIKRRGSKG
jgi:hypothetical protein